MGEGINNKKEPQIKTFNFKWYQFLLLNGILNIAFFLSINSVINNIYENYSKLHVSELYVDGADFSILANLFSAPIFAFLTLIAILICIIQELVIIMVLKFIYFKSVVNAEEMPRLNQYIKLSLLVFLLINITGIMFYGSKNRTILFTILYIPIPLFTFIFISSKIKRHIKLKNQDTSSKLI